MKEFWFLLLEILMFGLVMLFLSLLLINILVCEGLLVVLIIINFLMFGVNGM